MPLLPALLRMYDWVAAMSESHDCRGVCADFHCDACGDPATQDRPTTSGAPLHADCREAGQRAEEDLRAKLGKLLTGVAEGLRGPQPDGVWYDWSGLPKLAVDLTSRLTAIRGVVDGLCVEHKDVDNNYDMGAYELCAVCADEALGVRGEDVELALDSDKRLWGSSRLWELLEDAAVLLEQADFSNGVEHGGLDEGSAKGGEILAVIRAALRAHKI